MKPKVLAVIPARYQSSRFPGKPLCQIGGKSLLENLYRTVSRARLIDKVIVATDSDEISKAVKGFGGEVVKTSTRHKTGSDRAFEAADKLGGSIIVNIQADHLGVKAADYDRVLAEMKSARNIRCATFIKKIESEQELYDPNRVKVIYDGMGNAIWFSRYPIPFLQGVNGNRVNEFDFYYHIGVYFYRRAALAKFHNHPRTSLEKAESLEQLRILERGDKIRVFKIRRKIWSIDAPKDLKQAGNFII